MTDVHPDDLPVGPTEEVEEPSLDPEVPEADALEQSIAVPVDDDERG